MKKLFLFLLLLPAFAHSQIIYTYQHWADGGQFDRRILIPQDTLDHRTHLVLMNGILLALGTDGIYHAVGSGAAQVQTDWNATTGLGVLLNKPNLAAVALSGAMVDISGTLDWARVSGFSLGITRVRGPATLTDGVLDIPNYTTNIDDTAAALRAAIAGAGGGTPANPTAGIGFNAINGSAGTYMRSDAAPKFDTTALDIHTRGFTDGRYLQSISTTNSVQGDGSSGTPVKLAGDAATPGNSKYYGTDGGGAKGYFSIPAGVVIPPNAGGGFRIYQPQTPAFRSMTAAPPLLWDTTTSGQLNVSADTTTPISGLANQRQLSLKQNILISGNGTTINGNKVDLGGVVSANALLNGTNALTIQAKTNVRIGDSTSRIGLLFSDNFARSSAGANYAAVGSQTVTFPSSSYLQLGGTLDFTNNFYRTDYSGYNRFVDTILFVPTVINGTSYGPIINFYDADGYATGFRCQFGTASGGLMNIYMRDYTGTQVAIGGASLTISANDSMTAIVRRYDNTITATYKNRTVGGSDSTTMTYTFPTTSAGAQPATGHHAIGCLGGIVNVPHWSVNSDEPKRVTCIQGDSRYCGGYLASAMNQSIPYLLFPFRDLFSKLGGSGDKASDANNTFPQLDSLSPSYVLYALGINDATNSVALATFSASVVSYVTHCISKSIVPILTELPPNSSFPTKIYSDTLRAIAARYSLTMINGIYDALRSGTAYNSIYSSDGTHENNAGYAIELALIRAQAPQLFSAYNFITLNLPNATGGERLDLIDVTGKHHFGLPEAAYQHADSPLVVGTQNILPSSKIPGLSIQQSNPGESVAIIQNTSTAGYASTEYLDATGAIAAVVGFANSATAGTDPGYLIARTFHNGIGFRFCAGDQSTITGTDLLINHGAITPPVGNTAARPGTPTAGMRRYNTDSVADELYTTAWYRYLTSKDITSIVSSYAPLASPAFTGTPSLPTGTTVVTQLPGNNTTAPSSTAYTDAAVAAVKSKKFAMTADGAVNNTSTPTSLISTGVGSTTIPANTLIAGSIVSFKGSGLIQTALAAPSMQFMFNIGASGAGVTPTIGTSLNGQYEFEYQGIVRTAGASGSIELTGWVSITGVKTYISAAPYALDTTSGNLVDLVLTMSGTVGVGDVVTTKNASLNVQ